MEGLDTSKQIGANGCLQWVPEGEDHKANGDPAAPGGHSLYPAWRVGEADGSAAKPGQHPTDESVQIPNAGHLYPHHICGDWILTDSLQVKPRPGPIDEVPRHRDEQV